MASISRPIFIAGPARSGTSLLLSILSKATELWSPYRELHGLYEWEIGLAPDFTNHPNGTSGRDDNVLTEDHATLSKKQHIPAALFQKSANVELLGSSHAVGATYHALRTISRIWKRVRTGPIQIVDKNPKHCFRTQFLKEIFPDAQFVFLYRRPEPNINSLIEGWKSGRYATYKIPRSGGVFQWHFDLPPSWEEWIGMGLPERCAHQWVGYNRALLRAEERLPETDTMRCHYEEMIEHPLELAETVFDFIGVEMSDTVRSHCQSLPVVNSVTAPDPEKWRKREDEIRSVASVFSGIASNVGYEKNRP